ncbi:hypothetical protein MPH_05184 [Macrophomina phaseolina MS6]|uniref:Uncharacterized protein n=1 Tax=Macrophomina phaseolina (strain MS6) TaxID=1126212 RepID=K2RSA6_MACPH|nr:hypothetical protein MPH_05184 [Macrophomina phaseolina MS6]
MKVKPPEAKLLWVADSDWAIDQCGVGIYVSDEDVKTGMEYYDYVTSLADAFVRSKGNDDFVKSFLAPTSPQLSLITGSRGRKYHCRRWRARQNIDNRHNRLNIQQPPSEGLRGREGNAQSPSTRLGALPDPTASHHTGTYSGVWRSGSDVRVGPRANNHVLRILTANLNRETLPKKL